VTKVLLSTLQFKLFPVSALPRLFSYRKSLELEFNLTPLIEGMSDVDELQEVCEMHNWTIGMVDGGWCDFLDQTKLKHTLRSVDKQVNFLSTLGCNRLRLFFGHARSEVNLEELVARINRLCSTYPNINFFFETHDSFSCQLSNLEYLVRNVTSKNFWLLIDGANVIRFTVPVLQRFESVQSRIGHFHFKGLSKDLTYLPYHESEFEMRYFVSLARNLKHQASIAVEIEGRCSDNDLLESMVRLKFDLSQSN
jgi:sugar phosphate isomerase/epimerase